MTHIVDSPLPESPQPIERRSFLAKATAIVVGAIVTVFPFAAGLGVLLDPLRKRATGATASPGEESIKYVRLGPLDIVPDDGLPHQFALTDDVADAWTRSPAQRVGTAFLTRTDTPAGPKLTALSSVCPHLGCAVDYNASGGEFECPCHASAFAKDGQKLFGPSLRGLDPLAVKLVEQDGKTEIWVESAQFRAGIAERILVG